MAAAIPMIPMNPPGILDWIHIDHFVNAAEEGRSFELKVTRQDGIVHLTHLSFFEKVWDYLTQESRNDVRRLVRLSVRRINQRATEGVWAKLSAATFCRRAIIAEKYNQLVQKTFQGERWEKISIPSEVCRPQFKAIQLRPVSERRMRPCHHDGRYYNYVGEIACSHLSLGLGVSWRVGHLSSKEPRDATALQHAMAPIPRSRDLALQWIGHSTVLIQMGKLNILTDPIFGDLPGLDYRRADPGVALERLPNIDILLISHNHRDHLEKSAVQHLLRFQPLVMVPSGLEGWFEDLGFRQVVSHSWWSQTVFNPLESKSSDEAIAITALPAWHWSERGGWDQNESLWCGWAIRYGDNCVYFAGDTGYCQQLFSEVREEVGKIDVALLPIGPCDPMPCVSDNHLHPKQALRAFCDLEAELMIPIHWGTFRMGAASYDQPMQALKKALKKQPDLANFVCPLKLGERLVIENLGAATSSQS